MTDSDFLQISMSPEQRLSNWTLSKNQMTLGQLAENYPSIAWKEWLTALFPPTTIFTENEPIIVPVPSYIAKLENLIATTPKRDVANYMFRRAVYDSVHYLDEKIDQRSDIPRWKQCVNIVYDRLGRSTVSLFVKKHLSAKAKTTTDEISASIKAEFMKMLRSVN